jgi:SAM-dependent methyltransferase
MTLMSLAFGVEPGYAPYRLRQARYQALAETVASFARERAGQGRAELLLLDVGVGRGRSKRYLEAYPGLPAIRFFGVDRFSHGQDYVYKHEEWTLYQADLEQGLAFLASAGYDVVICEQVLEHLHDSQTLIAELERVLAPGGLLIVGVPVFWPGLELLRRGLLPLFDALTRRKKPRAHAQSFSKSSFLRLFGSVARLPVLEVRGFRFFSGSLLRWLEHFRWWWRLNRFLGRLLPALCTEIQVLAKKPEALAPYQP